MYDVPRQTHTNKPDWSWSLNPALGRFHSVDIIRGGSFLFWWFPLLGDSSVHSLIPYFMLTPDEQPRAYQYEGVPGFSEDLSRLEENTPKNYPNSGLFILGQDELVPWSRVLWWNGDSHSPSRTRGSYSKPTGNLTASANFHLEHSLPAENHRNEAHFNISHMGGWCPATC